jgi:HD-like signal output (HDOD) protein
MREKILTIINKEQNLPPLPEVLSKIEQKVYDPDTCISDVSSLIYTEPVLSGNLMRLANSVFIGGGRDKAEDLDNAIGRLGLKMVLDLAYTLELPKISSGNKIINQSAFWEHAFGTAICSRAISRLFSQDEDQRENAYLSGLMHDVGILVFFHNIPTEYGEFLGEFRNEEKSLEMLETESFGINHVELGAKYIEKWWPVSESVVDQIKRHHEPFDSTSKNVLGLANSFVNVLGFTNKVGPTIEEELDFTELLGASEAELEKLKEQTSSSIGELSSLFGGN